MYTGIVLNSFAVLVDLVDDTLSMIERTALPMISIACSISFSVVVRPKRAGSASNKFCVYIHRFENVRQDFPVLQAD